MSNLNPASPMTTKTKSNRLLAFHSDSRIKSKYLRRVRAHAKADEIVSGQYWENGRGCAVGCTLHSNQHAAYETELGIPQVLARLEDGLFERIFRHDPVFAKAWPERFLKAAKPGADLIMVWPRFAHWLMVDSEWGVIRFAKTEKTRAAINGVAELYARWIAGAKPEREEWVKARSYAYADAYAAAYAYAYADADADAYAYAYADAYADAYAAADARKRYYLKCAEKLLELMAEAK